MCLRCESQVADFVHGRGFNLRGRGALVPSGTRTSSTAQNIWHVIDARIRQRLPTDARCVHVHGARPGRGRARREPATSRGAPRKLKESSKRDVRRCQRHHEVRAHHGQVAAPLWHTLDHTQLRLFFSRPVNSLNCSETPMSHIISLDTCGFGVPCRDTTASWWVMWTLATCRLFDGIVSSRASVVPVRGKNSAAKPRPCVREAGKFELEVVKILTSHLHAKVCNNLPTHPRLRECLRADTV